MHPILYKNKNKSQIDFLKQNYAESSIIVLLVWLIGPKIAAERVGFRLGYLYNILKQLLKKSKSDFQHYRALVILMVIKQKMYAANGSGF